MCLSRHNQDGLGIDADMVDGKHASEFATTAHTHTCAEVGAPCGSWSFSGGVLYITMPVAEEE